MTGRACQYALQHEASGAVGVLGEARCGTALAEQCRLLIAGNAGERESFRGRAALASP